MDDNDTPWLGIALILIATVVLAAPGLAAALAH